MTQDHERPGRPDAEGDAEDRSPREGGSPRDARPRSLEQAFELDHAPAKVWAALTRGDLLARWLLPFEGGEGPEGGLEPGASFAFTWPEGEGGRVECEVVEVVPGRRLACTWRPRAPSGTRAPGDADTLVTFELTPLPLGRTRLRVRQVEIPAPARGATVMSLAAARARRAPPAMVEGATRPWAAAPLPLAA